MPVLVNVVITEDGLEEDGAEDDIGKAQIQQLVDELEGEDD